MADQNIPYVREVFGTLGVVRTVPGREMSASEVADADLLLVRSVTRVDEGLLAGSRVRFVATATIGTDHVDESYLAGQGIGFAGAAGGNANSVAEYVAAALLVLADRGGCELAGKTAGIIGVGNVGSLVVEEARALGLRVVENDPPLARQTGDPRYRPLEEALDCDFVTLHVPLTHEGPDATYHMVGGRFLSAMRSGSVLLNTSRGPVVVEDELKAALRSGHLSAAVLDVWENEPKIDVDLLKVASIGTPHIAGYSLDGKVMGTAMIYEAACRFLGVESTVDVRALMPEPPVPHLVAEGDGATEAIIRHIVRQVYDIMADDARLRKILDMPPPQRGECFDSLRKNYPVRREFHNTALTFRNCPEAAREALLGLGFRKADEEK